MYHLEKYVEGINLMRKFVNAPLITFPMSQDSINEIAKQIDCDMSPENLCCDGEISVSQARRKADNLYRAFGDLKKHAKDHGLSITVETYEI